MVLEVINWFVLWLFCFQFFIQGGPKVTCIINSFIFLIIIYNSDGWNDISEIFRRYQFGNYKTPIDQIQHTVGKFVGAFVSNFISNIVWHLFKNVIYRYLWISREETGIIQFGQFILQLFDVWLRKMLWSISMVSFTLELLSLYILIWTPWFALVWLLPVVPKIFESWAMSSPSHACLAFNLILTKEK